MSMVRRRIDRITQKETERETENVQVRIPIALMNEVRAFADDRFKTTAGAVRDLVFEALQVHKATALGRSPGAIPPAGNWPAPLPRQPRDKPEESSSGVQIVNGEPSMPLGESSVQALYEMLGRLKLVASSREIVLADPEGTRRHTLTPIETELLVQLGEVDKSCRSGAGGFHRSMRIDLTQASALLGAMELLEDYSGTLPRHYLTQRRLLEVWQERAHVVALQMEREGADV